MRFFLWMLCLVSFSLSGYASDPVHGCRVKTSVLQKHGSLINNAGCVIARKEKGETQFLLVYVAGGKSSGWGFPGGKPASKEVDARLDKQTNQPYSQKTFIAANNVSFDYSEPAVCTAYRETREETGLEVVVGELIDNAESFAAFHCVPFDLQQLDKLKAEDTAEIKRIGWFSIEQMKAKGFLRFESNLSIAETVWSLY